LNFSSLCTEKSKLAALLTSVLSGSEPCNLANGIRKPEVEINQGYKIDLNGDGAMEIVLYDAYHEGSASHVIEIKGAKATFVLNCTCEH